MEFKVFILLAIISGIKCSTIYPRSDIRVKAGEGFSTFLISDSEFGELLKCQIRLPHARKAYNVPKPGSEPIETEAGTIEAFEDSQCGAVVRNISQASSGGWELVAIDENLQRINNQFFVQILDISENVKPHHLVGRPGSEVSFTCKSDRGSNSNYRFCIIKDLQSGKKEKMCKKTVVYPESGKTEKYLCLVQLDGSTTFINQEVFVEGQSQNKDKSSNSVQASIKYLNSSTVLSCQFRPGQSNCFAIHLKSEEIVNIEDNLVGSRYSSHKSNLQEGLCQLEIPHPLMENETGTWKIVTLRDDSYNYNYERYSTTKENFEHGCFFNIESDGTEEVNQLRKRVSKPQKVKTLNERITIKCEEAPYTLKYCYLVTPSKSVIFNNQDNFEYSSNVGSCIFHEMKISSGLWKCGYNSPDENSIDIVQDIQIEYFPKLAIKVETPTVKVHSNGSFSLMCRTVVETPIKSCMFFTPNGDIYHLSDSKNKLYYGRGLDYGDCGITLPSEDTSKHLGVWSCNVLSYTKPDLELYGQIIVELAELDKSNGFEQK